MWKTLTIYFKFTKIEKVKLRIYKLINWINIYNYIKLKIEEIQEEEEEEKKMSLLTFSAIIQ